MIRSLSYAAHSGLDQFLTAHPELAHSPACESLTAWAVLLAEFASCEFLRAYRETIAANPALLPSPQQSQALLTPTCLKKRCTNCSMSSTIALHGSAFRWPAS
jgi:maltose alpha-D-glucosyltransferase / alpha-amylase